MKHQNLVLLAAVILIAAIPLVLNGGADFAGADDKIKGVLEQSEYKPWISALWEPPSAEVESFLFALQAALGAGFLGYFFGYQQGRKKACLERDRDAEAEKCCT